MQAKALSCSGCHLNKIYNNSQLLPALRNLSVEGATPVLFANTFT